VLSTGLRHGEEASCSTAAIPSSAPFSLARRGMSLESRSCMRPTGLRASRTLFAARHDVLFQDPCHEIPAKFSVKQRMRPYLPCPKQVRTLCL